MWIYKPNYFRLPKKNLKQNSFFTIKLKLSTNYVMIYPLEKRGRSNFMIYRNREGNIYTPEKMEYLAAGGCSHIFHNETEIWKEYFSDIKSWKKITPEIFDLAKSINNEHLIELFDIYTTLNSKEFEEYQKGNLAFRVDVYRAKYYPDDTKTVLHEPTDYLLHNFQGIENLFDIFTDNSVLTEDVKRENVVIGPNGIIIIDPDCFRRTHLPKEKIAIKNKEHILDLLTSICVNEMIEENYTKELINIYDLTSIEVTKDTDVTYEISKKLKGTKTPKDYCIKKVL